MRYLLSRTTRPILTRLAQQHLLCAFDFDGTLAPITRHPDSARMRARTRTLLGQLAAEYSCVIVSGRARADVLAHLDGVQLAGVIGNHGAEVEGCRAKGRRRLEKWKAALELAISSLPGVWVEDKGLSLAVHYRESPRRAEARRRVLKAAADLDQVRLFGGKQVINLVPAGAPGKREALVSERARLGCDSVLFIGDDENDEEAFALDGDTVGVRVGRKRNTRARYYLHVQTEIDDCLQLLISLRARANHKSGS